MNEWLSTDYRQIIDIQARKIRSAVRRQTYVKEYDEENSMKRPKSKRSKTVNVLN